MGAKKKKEEKGFVFVPPPVEEPAVEEEEKSEVQFTDTSYTSASFESLPPEPIFDEPKKKKKKKKGEEEVEEVVEVEERESEESFPPPAEEEEKQKIVEEPKKEKKGKKDKKDKKKNEPEYPDFEKPKNWKKMAKKEQDKWLKERIEQWQAEVEAEKQARLAGAKERKLAEARARVELAARDIEQQEIRRDLLQKTCEVMSRFENRMAEYSRKKQEKAEWMQYLRCDGLPDPRVVTQMATYLHVWHQEAKYDENELDRRCKEALPMLEMLEEFVANARNYTVRQARNYDEIRIKLRAQLALAIEFASYLVLRNLEKNMVWKSIKICTYCRVFEGLKLNLWVAVKMPTSKPLPTEVLLTLPPPLPVELDFPGIKVAVTLPNVVDGSCVCVRASRSEIDLLSESSRSFALKFDLPDRYQDLFQFNVKEHVAVTKLAREQENIRKAFYAQLRGRIRELEQFVKANIFGKIDKEKEELEELQIAEPPFMPDPRTHIGDTNMKNFKRYLKSNFGRLRPSEINLRKYRICGGILNMDLLVSPPQPKRMEYGITITRLPLPKFLQWVPYRMVYKPPPSPPPEIPRTPEVIEVMMSKIAKEMEKLALVTIDLPKDVLWNDPPIMCQWQETRKLWTSKFVIDFKFIEEKLQVQFRTGVMWPIGMACLRYVNMPYQGWDMKPDPKGKGVILVVTGVNNTVTWNIVDGYVKLVFVSNTNTPAMKQFFHKRLSVKKMVQLMRSASCDFFPDFDAHNYVEGTCPKEWVSERHLYHAMAFLSRSYNFAWSRWNVHAGYRKIVVQLRETVDPLREAKFNLLMVSPSEATILAGNEMMQEYDDTPMGGLKFYPDLFTLNMFYGSIDAKRRTYTQPFKLVETIFNFLQELKLCSFS